VPEEEEQALLDSGEGEEHDLLDSDEHACLLSERAELE
jgi:hypothetical protein